MIALSTHLERLEGQRNRIDLSDEQLESINEEINAKLDELDSLEKNASENELILKELQESLETNMQTRKRCQMMLMKL